ncbi:hypothetical protein ACFL6U_31620 [Planctomycetota bacterium]
MCRVLICVLSFVMVLAMPAWAWEFNGDANTEGWMPHRSFIDANDGCLVVTAPATLTPVRVKSPAGPYDGNEVTGFYIKMLPSKDVSALGGAQVTYYSGAGAGTALAFELSGDPAQPEVVYVAGGADWSGQIDAFDVDIPGTDPDGYEMKIDYIRLEGLYLDNESFEYWDGVNDKILGWTADGGYDFPDPVEPENVNSRAYAAVLTGTGTGQTIKQAIKGGSDMAKGQQLLLTAAFKVPAATADTKITLTISENGSTEGTVIAVDTVDAYFEGTALYTLQQEAADRQSLEAQITIEAPDGAAIYLDDIFVGVVAEAMERNPDAQYGWSSNCVKLAEGQEITIDGIVTPEEYAGAQAIVFNADTYRAVDPYDPNVTHNPFFVTGSHEMMITPLEDYNGVYYLMWDDENFYIAHTVQDDSHANAGNAATPQRGDCMQFTLSAEPNAAEAGQNYIPTVGVGPDGNAVAKNDFAANFGYMYDLFAPANTDPSADPRVEYAGSLDNETQDWSVELKIPWYYMIGDFPGDLANGDADGDGKNVFPPVIGQEAGYTLLPRDWEMDETGAVVNTNGMRATTHTWSNPWQLLNANPTAQTLTFVGPAE